MFTDLAKGQTFDKLVLEVDQLKSNPKITKNLI